MILGTRGSPLALRQTEWVRARLQAAHPGLEITLQVIRTAGDRQQQAPPDTFFGAAGGASAKGIFVKEIEEAMLSGRIDAAVHSLKDLPTEQPGGLAVSSIPAREDPRDALVSRDGAGIFDLPRGSRLGTSSLRRAAQLRAARPDLIVEPVRGNVDTRIRKVVEGRLDGVVLAAAGLARLGLLEGGAGASVHLIPEDVCLPAVGQGALAIEIRAGDGACRALVAAIHDDVAAAEVAAERAFLAALGGGCRVPVAALARAAGGRISLRGLVAAPDGSRMVRVSGESAAAEGERLGGDLARQALDGGASEILGQVGR